MKNHIFLTCLIKSIQFHNSHARNSAFLKSNTLTHNFKNNYDGYLSYTRSVFLTCLHHVNNLFIASKISGKKIVLK